MATRTLRQPFRSILLLLAALTPLTASLRASELQLNRIFTHHMVLQCDAPLPVFGTATPGETVTVTLEQQKKQTRAEADGRWAVTLNPVKAGGPYVLTILSGDKKEEVQDVLAGEVWLCSGQDNMQLSVKNAADAASEINAANYPQIRLFSVSNRPNGDPAGRTGNLRGEWQVCTPQTIPFFSAAAYYFGRELFNQLKVPVGLIETSWGGTGCESWLPAEVLRERPEFADLKKLLDSQLAAKNSLSNPIREQEKRWREYSDKYAAANFDAAPAVPEHFDSAWPTAHLPAQFEQMPDIPPGFDGAVWFRRTVEIPSALAGCDLLLSLGTIDDCDTTFFNGEKVGTTGTDVPNYWAQERRYAVPGRLVKAGKNTLAVRVFDNYSSGGFLSPAEQLYLQPASASTAVQSASGKIELPKIRLDGAWKYKVDQAIPAEYRRPENLELSLTHPEIPGGLYNTRIHPLIPYALRGVLWYQGEANLLHPLLYRSLFPSLIQSWRRAWKTELPFIYAQLANYQTPPGSPEQDAWAALREAQLQALTLPKTGMAVTFDIGNAQSLQPENKQEAGRRLALAALRTAYGRNVSASGPLYRGMELEGDKVKLNFSNTEGGLIARGGDLHGFRIAGEDRRFYPAKATLVSGGVLVSAPEVKQPKAVRYGWQSNPEGINLYNQAGLPASPFRTDDWPLVIH